MVLFRAVFGFALLGTYVFISLGAVGVEVALFRPLVGSRRRVLGFSFVLRVSAMASPAAWCLCRWVGWRVSEVVGGSGLGALLDDFSTFNNYKSFLTSICGSVIFPKGHPPVFSFIRF